MQLINYGIKLSLLQYGDIQLVRYWRNHPSIRANMSFRETITREMQEKWFHSINNIHNFYFLIDVEDERVGLINLKSVNYKKASTESGLFLWNNDLLNGLTGPVASLLQSEFVANVLNLKESKVKVASNNFKAIEYCKSLGYRFDSFVENDRFQFLTISIQDALSGMVRIKKVISKQTSYKEQSSIVFSQSQIRTPVFQFIKTRMQANPHSGFQLQIED